MEREDVKDDSGYSFGHTIEQLLTLMKHWSFLTLWQSRSNNRPLQNNAWTLMTYRIITDMSSLEDISQRHSVISSMLYF